MQPGAGRLLEETAPADVKGIVEEATIDKFKYTSGAVVESSHVPDKWQRA